MTVNISIDGAPFSGKRRLFNVVQVQFRTHFIKQDFDSGAIMLRPGDHVIVETDKGPAIARVQAHVSRKVLPNQSLKRVIRKAQENDIERADQNEAQEAQAYHFGVERIRERKLPMKLVRAQYMHDSSRIVFYFSAEGRIDFRDLVKDLAHKFRTRIEMHQIGVRDGTRMIGGIGSCGRELCCSTFLDNFAPVSIRMAKDQGLTLNPQKVSGMCGRLMCCLVYEQTVYRRMRKRMPRAGQKVDTPDGLAKVRNIDVINQRVMVELEDTNRRTYSNTEIRLHDPKRPKSTVDADAQPDYLWDDLAPEAKPKGDKPKNRRSKRRGEASGRGRSKNESGSGQKSDGPSSSRRRRRRGKGGSQEQGKQGGQKRDGQKQGGQKQDGQKQGGQKQGGQKQGGQQKSDSKSDGTKPRRRRRRRGKKDGQSGGQGPKPSGPKPKGDS